MSVGKPTTPRTTAMWLCAVLLLPSFAFAVAELAGVTLDLAGARRLGDSEILSFVAFIGAGLAPFGFVAAMIVSVFVAVANRRDGAQSPRLWILMAVGLLLQFLIYTMLRQPSLFSVSLWLCG
jgi:hypothetical protein